jgi:hypothetical protein
LKYLNAICSVVLLLSVPKLTSACSLISCSTNDEDEVRRDFTVRVTLGSAPLAKVNTWVTQWPGDEKKLFTGVTGTDGNVRVSGLPPGEYWLYSELLGISAGGVCLKINSHPSKKAKRIVTFQWGDSAQTTQKVAGRLIDPAPGEGAAFLQNILKHVVDPIPEAKLELRNPLTGAIYTTLSDTDGRFSFGEIPSGTYVIHIEGGLTPAGHEFEPTDLLIQVADTASRNMLLLERSGGSTCGGPTLILEWPYRTL